MRKIFAITIISLLFFTACSEKHLAADEHPSTDAAKNDTTSRDGSSFKRAIVIKATNEGDGGSAEYKWLAQHYPGYSMGSQALVFQDKKPFDILYIKTANGISKEVYFDISNYFGKW